MKPTCTQRCKVSLQLLDLSKRAVNKRPTCSRLRLPLRALPTNSKGIKETKPHCTRPAGRQNLTRLTRSMRITGNHMLEHRIIPKFPVLVVVLFVLCSTRGLAHEFMAHGAKGGSSSRLPLPMLKSWRYTPPNEIRLPIEGSLESFTVCLGYGR